MLQSDSFWALVGLILFLVLIASVGVPKMVLQALDKRTARIKAELDEARKNREEAQALLAEYQRKRLDAEREAEEIVEEARREAKRLTEDAEAKLSDMVARRTQTAESKIAQAEAQALSQVRDRAADIAVAAAADVLRAKFSGGSAESDALFDRSVQAVRTSLN